MGMHVNEKRQINPEEGWLQMNSMTYTLFYVGVVPVLGFFINRILYRRFATVRNGESKAAWWVIALVYTVYVVGYGFTIWLVGFSGPFLIDSLILLGILAGIGLMPLVIKPASAWFAVSVSGLSWALAALINMYGVTVVIFAGTGAELQNYFTEAFFGSICRYLSGSVLFRWFCFQIEFLLPAVAGYLVGWLSVRRAVRETGE